MCWHPGARCNPLWSAGCLLTWRVSNYCCHQAKRNASATSTSSLSAEGLTKALYVALIFMSCHGCWLVVLQDAQMLHMSYHDGEHYNSVRLKDDLQDQIPRPVPAACCTAFSGTPIHEGDEAFMDDKMIHQVLPFTTYPIFHPVISCLPGIERQTRVDPGTCLSQIPCGPLHACRDVWMLAFSACAQIHSAWSQCLLSSPPLLPQQTLHLVARASLVCCRVLHARPYRWSCWVSDPVMDTGLDRRHPKQLCVGYAWVMQSMAANDQTNDPGACTGAECSGRSESPHGCAGACQASGESGRGGSALYLFRLGPAS